MGVAVQMRTLARIPGRGYTCGPWRGSLGVAGQMRTLARIPGCSCADEDPSGDPCVWLCR